MEAPWFRPRSYKHFDVPVGPSFAAKVLRHDFARKNDWAPLIHYVRGVRRYKPLVGKTILKNRSIMYASHRDACILSGYSNKLTQLLEECYKSEGLDRSVIAYRALGKANYHFATDTAKFAESLSPCVVLCFDITGFFDNLDHAILKSRLKELLCVSEISEDWFSVFRHVTAFRKVEREALAAHPDLGIRLKARNKEPIATIAEVKAFGVAIEKNPNKRGIPQGTPISSAFSNLYMLYVDRVMTQVSADAGALYQRYSDDLIIICKLEAEKHLRAVLSCCVDEHKLEIHPEKFDRAIFNSATPGHFQYLGFDISPEGALIRARSLSRQWRKLRRSVRKAHFKKAQLQAAGGSVPFYTKKLRQRFSPVGVRNFSLYARHAAGALESDAIRRQVLKLERTADREIRALKDAATL